MSLDSVNNILEGEDSFSRRQILAGLGIGAATATTGCMDNSGNPGETNNPSNGQTGTGNKESNDGRSASSSSFNHRKWLQERDLKVAKEGPRFEVTKYEDIYERLSSSEWQTFTEGSSDRSPLELENIPKRFIQHFGSAEELSYFIVDQIPTDISSEELISELDGEGANQETYKGFEIFMQDDSLAYAVQDDLVLTTYEGSLSPLEAAKNGIDSQSNQNFGSEVGQLLDHLELRDLLFADAAQEYLGQTVHGSAEIAGTTTDFETGSIKAAYIFDSPETAEEIYFPEGSYNGLEGISDRAPLEEGTVEYTTSEIDENVIILHGDANLENPSQAGVSFKIPPR